jgi:uncharacterized protein with FMN-binding domain/ferredoxin
MKKMIFSLFMFVFLIGCVVVTRINPTLFDFNIIHNSYSLNILYRDQVALPWLVGLFSLLITLIFGPVFCGYICPFGTLQRVLNLIGQTLGLKRKLPLNAHKVLSNLKYIILIVFVVLIRSEQVLIYINIDPYHAFIRLFFGGITLYGGLYLITIILMALFIERPFCNYLCPYGAGLNLVSVQRVFRIERTDACIMCKKCDHNCPVQIDITRQKTVTDINCISCDKCIDACPKQGAIKKSYNPNSLIFVVILIATAIMISKPVVKPVISDAIIQDNIKVVDEVIEEVVEEVIIKEPLKVTSTVNVYYDNSMDILPISITYNKNADAISKHKEELTRIEAERKAQEEAVESAAKLAAEKAAAEKAAAEKLAAEIAEQEAADFGGEYYRDGTYTAKVNAYRPDMVVKVTIKNDKIISVDVTSHNETGSYFRFAAPKMFQKIIDNNTPEVSIVSRCTYTSLGIKNGVRGCLLQAER